MGNAISRHLPLPASQQRHQQQDAPPPRPAGFRAIAPPARAAGRLGGTLPDRHRAAHRAEKLLVAAAKAVLGTARRGAARQEQNADLPG